MKDSSFAEMPLTILGCGNAGSALAAALINHGVEDLRLWARNPRRGRARARAAGANFENDLTRAIAHPGLLLIAVSDQAVPRLARQLARCWPEGNAPSVVLHTAGALSGSALAPLERIPVATGVFHPVISLLGPASADKFPGGFATISGSKPALLTARALARLLEMNTIRVEDESRPLVHMAAVMAAGDLTALLAQAQELLHEAGLAPATARKLLGHLAQSAVYNYSRKGAGRAITGPAARGDAHTLAAHLEAAANSRAGRRVVAVHRHLARTSAEQAHASGRLDRAGLTRIQRLLTRRT